LKIDELKDLVLKFIRISKKKDQQKTIEEIKVLLKKLGYGAFWKKMKEIQKNSTLEISILSEKTLRIEWFSKKDGEAFSYLQ